MAYSIAQLQQLAASVGFPVQDVPTAAAIAMAESGGNPNAHGDLNLGAQGSIGLWQIFTKAHPNFDPAQLTDPVYNAKAALAVSSGGGNWAPWSTWWADAAKRIGPGQGVFRKYLQPFSGAVTRAAQAASPWLLAAVVVGGAGGLAWWLHKQPRRRRGRRRR